MQRFFSTLTLLACLILLTVSPAAASWFFGPDTLVSIDGKNYTTDDFQHWWKFWNDDKSPLPKTPEPYIDWLLLAREGKRMELDSDPSFKRQTRIFLESRTLFMLKYDEVDSKVKVTDADVKARYEEKFLPRWQVERLQFKDEAEAMEAWKQLKDGTLKVADLVAKKGEEGGPDETKADWLRPNRIDPGWATIFKEMKVGELVDPEKYGKGPILYYLKAQKGGDDEDLKALSPNIRKDLAREQENTLTRDLIKKLRDKYQVKVDEKRIAALDINAPEDTYTDDPVITTTQQTISEKQFMAVIHKVIKERPTVAISVTKPEGVEKLKAETVDNILAQALTNWESLDRHFEEKEPFKWEYEFNYNHRLGLALERRLFSPQINISDEDVKQEYEKHIDRYSQPALVKLYIVDETQGPIDKMWAEVASGKNFDEVVRKAIRGNGQTGGGPRKPPRPGGEAGGRQAGRR